MSYSASAISGLPDPEFQADFYNDVPGKRFVAWIVDTVLIAIATFILSLVTLGVGFLLWALFYLGVGFVYRWFSLARGSATPGMRLLAIEMRAGDGHRFDSSLAFLHTLGFYVSWAFFPLQLISMIMMVSSERRQGLSDMLLGTAAVNRAARF